MVHFYAKKACWQYRNHGGLKINGSDSTDPTRRGGQNWSVFSHYEIYLTADSGNPASTMRALCAGHLPFSVLLSSPLLFFFFLFDMPGGLFYSLVMNCPSSHSRFRMLKSRHSPEPTKGSCFKGLKGHCRHYPQPWLRVMSFSSWFSSFNGINKWNITETCPWRFFYHGRGRVGLGERSAW